MTVIDHEQQMDRPSHGRGVPCGARSTYRLAADYTQGRGHVSPVGHEPTSASGLSLTDLLLNSGGLRLPHFSQFSLRGGLSSRPVLRKGDRLRPLPHVAGRHKFRSRSAGCHRPGRVRRCPGIGLINSQAAQYAVQGFFERLPSHRHGLSVVGFDTHTEPREANYAVLQIPTFGTRHDR